MDYVTAFNRAEDLFTEKKSKFIGSICPVEEEEQALHFINEIRARNPQARHIVYAYILRKNNIMRYSDAGEPSGTGGQPILQVLQREGLTDVCVTVTRYFGGILLGAGGLTRAYAKAAKCALDAAGIARMQLCSIYRICCSYALYERLSAMLARQGCEVFDIEFLDDVSFCIALLQDSEENVLNFVSEYSAGEARCKKIEEKYKKCKK